MDLPHLGSRCAVEHCRQFDFLPFRCHKCSQQYCLEHRGFEEHACPVFLAERAARTVPVCEKCHQLVPLKPDQSRDAALQAHQRAGCPKEEGLLPDKKSPPCGVPGCVATHCMRIMCSHCKVNFCVEHRLAEDHHCARMPTLAPKPKPKPKATSAPKAAAKAEAVGPKGIHLDDRFEFTMYLPPGEGKALRAVRVFVPRKWSVGKAVEWLCDQFRVTNNAQRRNRLVTLEPSVSVVPNHVTLQQCGADGLDFGHGVVLVPEEWITSPPTRMTAANEMLQQAQQQQAAGPKGCGWEEHILQIREQIDRSERCVIH